MKVTYSVILFVAALAATHCYPAENKAEKEPVDKDVDFVPLEERQPGAGLLPGGVVDVDASGDGFFGNPFVGNPFPSFLSGIEELMARMRQQLSQILGRLPSEKPESGVFPELHLPNLGDIDLGKGNTTSVTKVIDGHKVTINETEYKQDGDNGAAFFKVRVIDVHPDSEETVTEKDAEVVPQPKKDREDISNEISKVKDNEALNLDNIETFDEVDLLPPHKYTSRHKNSNWDNVRSVESLEDNSIDYAPQPVRDLSNDIYVNQLMADAGAPTNPDAEVFEVVDGRLPLNNYPQAEKIVPFNFAYPNQGGILPNYPRSDFEQAGMQHGPIPVFDPLPMPYYADQPIFPMQNHFNQQFDVPMTHFVPPNAEQMFIRSGFPQYIRPKNVPEEKRSVLPQPSPSNKIQIETNAIPQGEVKHPNAITESETKHQESSSASNIPKHVLPAAEAPQVPST